MRAAGGVGTGEHAAVGGIFAGAADDVADLIRPAGAVALALLSTLLAGGAAQIAENTSVDAAADGTPSAVWQQFPAQSVIRTATAELASPPGAPTSVTATPGDGRATVAWSPPTSDGGRAVTSYTATATPGGASCTTASSTCELTGLTNGTEYQVSVTATNAVGTGPAAIATVRPSATPVAQSVKKPPAKLKKGKKAKLAKKTTQGAKVTWKTSTKKVCTVKKYKVTAKKKGKCKLSAKAPAITGYTAFSKKYTIKVK